MADARLGLFKRNYPQGSQSHSAMKLSVPESRTQGLMTAQVRDGCNSLDHEGLGLGVRHERAVTREEAQRLFRVEQELHKREKLRNPVPIATVFAVRMPHATDYPNATKSPSSTKCKVCFLSAIERHADLALQQGVPRADSVGHWTKVTAALLPKKGFEPFP